MIDDNLLTMCTTETKVIVRWRVAPVNFSTDDWTTIIESVQSGNHPYKSGDTKTIEMDIDADEVMEEYTIRVANTTSCSEE